MNDPVIELNNDDAITLAMTGYIEVNDVVHYRDRYFDSFHEAFVNVQPYEVIAHAGSKFYILSPLIGRNQSFSSIPEIHA